MSPYSKDELFFQHVTGSFFADPTVFEGLRWIVVSHIVKDVAVFLDALQGLAPIQAIVSKQHTIDKRTYAQLTDSGYTVYSLNREDLQRPEHLQTLFGSEGKYLIVDVGGYFAHALPPFIQSRVAGVVECTENGHQRYAKLLQSTSLSYPVYSVARSPLKENEDDLVGHSIGFYTEMALRQRYVAPQRLIKGVIGYGKVGRGIAAYHLRQQSPPLVFDKDPIAMVQALKDGCIPVSRDELLRRSDVLFCATGAKSVTLVDLPKLKDGCFLASATSADDEFDFTVDALVSNGYNALPAWQNTQEIKKEDQSFILINKGNSANFSMTGDRVGDFIRPVQAEVMAAVAQLLRHKLPASEIMNVDRAARQKLAHMFLSFYNEH